LTASGLIGAPTAPVMGKGSAKEECVLTIILARINE
jgi:hypothetical protein